MSNFKKELNKFSDIITNFNETEKIKKQETEKEKEFKQTAVKLISLVLRQTKPKMRLIDYKIHGSVADRNEKGWTERGIIIFSSPYGETLTIIFNRSGKLFYNDDDDYTEFHKLKDVNQLVEKILDMNSDEMHWEYFILSIFKSISLAFSNAKTNAEKKVATLSKKTELLSNTISFIESNKK